MNTNFNKDYNVIVNALHNKNLLAYTKEGEFKEVNFQGRVWRSLVGQITKENTFEDCYEPMVGNKIVNFVKENISEFTPEQKKVLIEEMTSLAGRVKENAGNIGINIRAIKDIFNMY